MCPCDGSGDVGEWRAGLEELCRISLGLWVVPWSASHGSSVIPEGPARTSHVPGLGWRPHLLCQSPVPHCASCADTSTRDRWSGGTSRGMGSWWPGPGTEFPWGHGPCSVPGRQERPNGQQRVSGGGQAPSVAALRWKDKHL